MTHTKAPNVLFDPVSLFFFFFPFATAVVATASQKVKVSGEYFSKEKRSMPIQLSLTLDVALSLRDWYPI